MSNEYVPMVGNDYQAWLFGAADRRGLTAPPDDKLPSLQEGYMVVGKASAKTLGLFACIVALHAEVEEKRAEVHASDSKRMQDAFDREVAIFVDSGLETLEEIAARQLRIDLQDQLQDGDGKQRYKGLMLVSGGNVIGFNHPMEVAALLIADNFVRGTQEA